MDKLQLTNDGGNDLTAISGVAYSGGTIRQPWCEDPMVIDLAGFTSSAQIPLLYNHINDPSMRLGEVKATVAGGAVLIDGGIDASGERGRRIVEAGKRVKWQLSIGADIIASKRVTGKATVNGTEFDGPLFVVAKCELREVSVVAVGADDATELNIAASWTPAIELKLEPNNNNNNSTTIGEKTMAEEIEKEMETPVCAEETVTETPAPVEEGNDLQKQIDELKKALAAMCEKPAEEPVKASRGSTNIIVKSGAQSDSRSIEAALSLRAGMDEATAVKTYGERTVEAGYALRNMSLKDVTRECLKASGRFSSDFIGHDDIQAGFQTTDLPKLLGNVANKALLKAYEAREIAATKLCSAGDIADYKQATRVRISDLGALDEIPAGGEVTETSIGEDYAINQVKRYAQVFWLDEALIINDDLGAFTRLPQVLGAKAADFLDYTFFKALTSNGNFTDGKALFHADHKNLVTGANTALDLAALKKAYSSMRKQCDKGGMPLNVVPKFLVVPAALEAEALELTTSQTATGGSTRGAGENVISKWGLQVVSSPYLDGNSEKAWYLFGDPAVCDTFEIGYLRGQRTPVVEQGAYDLSRFGVGYRVRFDFGVMPMDFRSVYKAKGEA